MTPSEQNRPNRGILEKGAIQGLKELFKQAGGELNEADLPELGKLSAHKPDYPPFPILIVLMAIMKDVADIFLNGISDLSGLTVVGLIVTFFLRAILTAFTFIVATILFIWVLGKINRLQKIGFGVTKFFVRRYVKKRIALGATGVLFEWILPLIPFSTLFVLLAHYDENKYVKFILAILEQIGKAKKAGKLKMPSLPQRQQSGGGGGSRQRTHSSGEEQSSPEPGEGGMTEAGSEASKAGFGPL